MASAVGTIVVNGIKLCLSVYGTIDGMKQAPKHLKAISLDLKDFYSTLGTIQVYLDDKELTQGLLRAESCDNLQSILANCVSVLKDFEKIVSGYIKAGQDSQESSVTTWHKVSWTWKLANVEDLRKHLSDHKASLSVAIGMANLINNDMARRASASRNATDMQEIREVSASQWADAKAEIAAIVAKLHRLDETMHDSNVIMQNQRDTIRAFANDAESILTCSLVEPTWVPSLRVSTLIVDSSRSASFVTSRTSATPREAISNNAVNTVYPRQLMIHGIGGRTIVLHGSSEFRYGHHLMVAVEEKTFVPTIYFWLTYAGKVIREMTDMSSVPHDATVFAHYRAVGKGGRFHRLEEEQSSDEYHVDDLWEGVYKQRKKNEATFAQGHVMLPREKIWRRVLTPHWRRPSRWKMSH